jgi:hypothetical protein
VSIVKLEVQSRAKIFHRDHLVRKEKAGGGGTRRDTSALEHIVACSLADRPLSPGRHTASIGRWRDGLTWSRPDGSIAKAAGSGDQGRDHHIREQNRPQFHLSIPRTHMTSDFTSMRG